MKSENSLFEGLEQLSSLSRNLVKLSQSRVKQELYNSDFKSLVKPKSGLSDSSLLIGLRMTSDVEFDVGLTLSDFDKELRRTAAYLINKSLNPIQGTKSIRVVSGVEVQSLDFTIEVLTTIYQLLSSRPLDFMMTLSFLWEHRPASRGSNRPTVPKPPSRIVKDARRAAKQILDESQNRGYYCEADPDGSFRWGFTGFDHNSD